MIDSFAFADDIAVGTTSYKNFHSVMTLVDHFTEASGLGVNKDDKTVIVSTKRGALQRSIASSPWPDTTLAESHLYLGILFGANVSLDDIFQRPLERMKVKVSECLNTIRRLPRHKRVLFFNIFIFSKLRYLLDFFPLPFGKSAQSAEAQVRHLARICTIRYNGTAYPYYHLVQPPHRFGPAPAVWDGWALSMANMAAQADLTQFHGATSVPKRPDLENSLHISDLIQLNAMDFVCYDIGASFKPNATFNANKYTDLDFRERSRKMYKRLVATAYREDWQDADLEEKLTKRGSSNPDLAVDYLHAHYASLPTSFSGWLRSTQFDIVFNALSTSHRYAAAAGIRTRADRIAAASNCHFCGEGIDSAHHIFSDCEIVKKARLAYMSTVCLDEPGTTCNEYDLALLAFPPISPKHTQATITFNGAIWSQRCSFFRHLPTALPERDAINRLARVATLDFLTPTNSTRSLYGSAGNRDERQTKAAQDYAARVLADIPPNAWVCYTDGSAIGNPGPAGSGAYISRGDFSAEEHVGIGDSTNNIGELWAMGLGLTTIRSAGSNSNDPIYILSDSHFSIGAVRDFWNLKNSDCLTVARAVRATATSLAPARVFYRWLPAHLGINGNEIADHLANCGSNASARGHHVPLIARIKSFNVNINSNTTCNYNFSH